MSSGSIRILWYKRSTAKAELEQPWPSKALGAIGARLLAIVASGGWWKLRDRTSAPIESTVAPTTARYPQDRRMSVVVLPFENSSGDPAQDGIAAGFARDVMSLLGQNRVPVIPAATSAVYRGNTTDLHKVGRDHNVHFAITGDARRQGGRRSRPRPYTEPIMTESFGRSGSTVPIAATSGTASLNVSA